MSSVERVGYPTSDRVVTPTVQGTIGLTFIFAISFVSAALTLTVTVNGHAAMPCSSRTPGLWLALLTVSTVRPATDTQLAKL